MLLRNVARLNIQTFLQEVGAKVASTLATTFAPAGFVYLNRLPGNAVDAVLISGTGGVAPRSGEPVRLVTTQILVRSRSFLTGLSNAQKIFDALDEKFNILQTVKGRCEPLAPFSGANYLDANNLYVFPLNFQWRIVWAAN